MPCLKIWTNVSKNKVATDFVEKIIPTLSKALRKPEERFVCMLSTDNSIHLNGDSKSPVAIATLESIGNLAPEDNITTTKLITDFVQKELGVEPKRFLLTFYDMKPENVAVNGTTVAGAMK